MCEQNLIANILSYSFPCIILSTLIMGSSVCAYACNCIKRVYMSSGKGHRIFKLEHGYVVCRQAYIIHGTSWVASL